MANNKLPSPHSNKYITIETHIKQSAKTTVNTTNFKTSINMLFPLFQKKLSTNTKVTISDNNNRAMNRSPGFNLITPSNPTLPVYIEPFAQMVLPHQHSENHVYILQQSSPGSRQT